MIMATKSDARLSIRLPGELKQIIEQAAAQLGQSVSDFAISTLVKNARAVIQQHDITELSSRVAPGKPGKGGCPEVED